MPRFNISWIFILAIVALIALYVNSETGPVQPTPRVETSYTDFQSYMNKGYASKLVVDKTQGVVKMYVKPEHIRDIFKQGADQVGTEPYISVEIGSLDKFETFVEEKRAEQKFAGKVTYEAKHGDGFLSNLFWSVFPFLLIIGVWMFLMRRMGGGGSGFGGGGIFSVGKSRAKM